MSDDVAGRLASVREAICAACVAAGRAPSTVRLVAVSKGQPVDSIRAAWTAGQRDFGENYAQELRAKQAALADLDGIVWHFVGRVQRGNARTIAGAALVHGVGSVAQADALDHEARRRGMSLPVLLQVNLIDEASKNGFTAEAVRGVLPALRGLGGLQLTGFMAMPLVEPAALPEAFAAVRRLRDGYAPDLSELSMGMSGDFVEAIAAGATLVRVGTRIFGPRAAPRPDSEGGPP
ncbi:MAG: YggS family pyridoxal phosphate-dependent enzyme [Deltaproteobacteria bacterium]|nr:YggS family pyridoxal phosphate-dependent enzyme [Deltaproteobacteria bacterium]